MELTTYTLNIDKIKEDFKTEKAFSENIKVSPSKLYNMKKKGIDIHDISINNIDERYINQPIIWAELKISMEKKSYHKKENDFNNLKVIKMKSKINHNLTKKQQLSNYINHLYQLLDEKIVDFKKTTDQQQKEKIKKIIVKIKKNITIQEKEYIDLLKRG